MRARPGFGVVLHREGGDVATADAFNHAVVEIDMGDVGTGDRALGDGEVVILARDLDAARRDVAHRMVPAVMAERQLVGGAAEGRAHQLVAEADAEHRDLAEEGLDLLHRVVAHHRVAGAVGQEDTVRIVRAHIISAHMAGDDGDGGEPRQVAQDGALDAEVVGHDPEGPVAHGVRLERCHLGNQVDPVGARLVERGLLQHDVVSRAERSRHGAGVADVAGEATGVDPSDAGHLPALQEGVEVLNRAPVAAPASQLPHDHATGEGSAALVVLRVRPVVADVRVRERDDLAGVTGVGDDLLVAGEDGVEHDLARGHARLGSVADGLALEVGPVGQHQQGVVDRGAHAVTSSFACGDRPSRRDVR